MRASCWAVATGPIRTPARRIRGDRRCVAIRAIGFVEESSRPQRVTVERDGFRIFWCERLERFGFALGTRELGDLQRGTNGPFTSANGQLRVARLGGLVEGLQRFLVTRFVVEERGELQLQIRIGIGRSAKRERPSDEQREYDDARPKAR